MGSVFLFFFFFFFKQKTAYEITVRLEFRRVLFRSWEINGNVAYRFTVPARSSFRPYAGGGLNIAHASAGPSGGTSVSATKAGLNLLGGTTFKLKGRDRKSVV